VFTAHIMFRPFSVDFQTLFHCARSLAAKRFTWVAMIRKNTVVYQFMDVSFGVGCLSTQIENCWLRTMTLSDNCCVNQDGAVRQGCLYTIMFRRLML